jgi:hypothetical protein
VLLEASPVHGHIVYISEDERAGAQSIFVVCLMLGLQTSLLGRVKWLWCIDIDTRAKHVASFVGHVVSIEDMCRPLNTRHR